MAANDPLTPEKQLLNLIEHPKREALQVESAKREGMKWISPGALKGRFAFWKSFSFRKLVSFRELAGSSFGIRQVNLALTAATVLLAAYLVYQAVMMGIELKRAANLILPKEK